MACNGGTMLPQAPDCRRRGRHRPLPPRSPPEAVLVDVVVLTADPELFQAARDAVGERNPVWRARSSDEAADLLITGRCGVLLIDMAAVSTRADTLIQQIVEQFPDVVVCVAGTRGRRAPARAPDQRWPRLPVHAQAGLRAPRRHVPAGGDPPARRAARGPRRQRPTVAVAARPAPTDGRHAARLPRLDRPGGAGADRAALRRRRT